MSVRIKAAIDTIVKQAKEEGTEYYKTNKAAASWVIVPEFLLRMIIADTLNRLVDELES